MVRDYVKAAHMGKTVSCHLFRHACATHIHENGADIRMIQAMLGHAKLETTQIYPHLSIKQLQKVHASPSSLEDRETKRGNRTRGLKNRSDSIKLCRP